MRPVPNGKSHPMLEIWFSVGYILLLAIRLFVFILWRSDSALIAIAALVVGLAYLTWWEYARPTWTTGTVSGTEVRRSEADARGMTHDIQYVYMRNRARSEEHTLNSSH